MEKVSITKVVEDIEISKKGLRHFLPNLLLSRDIRGKSLKVLKKVDLLKKNDNFDNFDNFENFAKKIENFENFEKKL